MRCALLLICTSACSQLFGFEEPTVATTPDGPSDAPPDGPSLCYAIDQMAFSFCLESEPGANTTVTGDLVIQTNLELDCAALQPGSADVCVVSTTLLTIESTGKLLGVGRRPLVLLASKTLTIAGLVDVASRRDLADGAGFDGGGCSAGIDATQGAGGYGGSFGTVGGGGGDQNTFPASGGVPGPGPSSAVFRGGCAGSDGGQNGNSKGSGGGALMLIADELVLRASSSINASGSGGKRGTVTDNGGGGGGSGGMIVIVSPEIQAGGNIFANGGGGGGGSSDLLNGEDGGTPVGGAPGTSGLGGDLAGSGGAGFPSLDIAGASGTGNGDGGGGGGGGAGVIRVFGGGSLAGAVVSPAAM